MHRLATSFALLAFAALAHATHVTLPAPPSTPSPVSTSTSSATGGKAESNSAADANSKSLSNASLEVNSEYRDRLQAPAISAPPVYASGNCAYGWSAGVSVPGAGVSGGKATPDKDCNRRELVRVITPLNPWLALKVACEDPLIVDMLLRNLATREDCQYVPPSSAPGIPAVMREIPPAWRDPFDDGKHDSDEAYATRKEVRETVDKAFKQTTKK